MKAQVYKIHSDFYYVKTAQGGEIITCKLREVLKKSKIKIKVGDFVEIENSNAITKLLERRNTLERPSVSNLDLTVVVSSMLEPKVDYIQLNRYLTFLKYNEIPVLLCFNKDDLKDFSFKKREILSIYEPIGYKIFFTSAVSKKGLDELKNQIRGKTVAFCGLSGVGKSSLLNALSGASLKTGSISHKNKNGTHTTRHLEIIEFGDFKIIDTPGFSKLTFDFILPKNLSSLFYDIDKFSSDCKYDDCLHTKKDVDCAVIKNLYKIPASRYKSYLKFLIETKEYKKRVTFESQKEETATKENKMKDYVKINTKKRLFSRKKSKQNLIFEGVEDD